MTFYREPNVEDFDPERTRALMRLVTPHVQGALRLFAKFDQVQTECRRRESALDTLSIGVMLFDHDGCVSYANHRALAVLKQSQIAISGTRLKSANSGVVEKLHAALKKAVSGTASLIKVKDSQWLCGPLPPASWLTAERNSAIVLVSEGRRHAPTDQFAASHGLTRAETRLLEGLLEEDGDPKRLALKFDIAVSTVRTQLRSIYLKTGTRGQRDLIQRILALPPALLA